MEPVTPEEYVRIRDEKCAKEGYVHWDVDAVSYAMELAASCGGGTAAVSCEDKNTQEIKVFCYEYNYEEIAKYIKRLENIQKAKHRLMKHNKLVKRAKDCTGYNCKMAEACNMREVCYGKEKERI